MMGTLQKSVRLVSGMLLAAAVVAEVSADLAPVKSKFDVSLYGYVKLDASYDTQRTQNGNLMLYVLPEGAGGKQDEFNMSARETRLGLNIAVPELDEMLVTGRLEMDFFSGAAENAPNPRMRLAYVDVARGDWALRAGQDWETFITVLPRIVNFGTMWNAGTLGARRPLVRLTRAVALSDCTRLVAKVGAARTIGDDLDGGGQNDGAAAGYPTGQANLALDTTGLNGRRIVLSVSGHAGTEKVSAYVDNTNPASPVAFDEKEYATWSIIGSLVVPLTDWLQVQGTIWTGENLTTYFGGIGQGINRQQETGIAAQGGCAQIVLNPTMKLNVNLGYGLDEPDRDDLHAGNRSKNELIFANAYYNLTHAVTLATEVSHMNTSYLGASSASNDRVQAALLFRF